jgi:serine phosphatase RsbU (regulator of sigma subunit)
LRFTGRAGSLDKEPGVTDVTGNGLDAALIMVTFRAYLHATVMSDLAMRVVMARINRLVHEATGGERFITSF